MFSRAGSTAPNSPRQVAALCCAAWLSARPPCVETYIPVVTYLYNTRKRGGRFNWRFNDCNFTMRNPHSKGPEADMSS